MEINLKIKRLTLHGFDTVNHERLRSTLVKTLTARLSEAEHIKTEGITGNVKMEMNYRDQSQLASRIANNIGQVVNSKADVCSETNTFSRPYQKVSS